MVLRRLTPSNIPYQGRQVGGIFGSPIDVPAGNTDPFVSRVVEPRYQDLFEIENAPPGFTVDDIVREVVRGGGTLDEAKAIAQRIMPEQASDFSEQDWQDNWAKNYRDRMYDGENPPALNETASSGDGSYYQEIPGVVEARYPLEGSSGSSSLRGADTSSTSGIFGNAKELETYVPGYDPVDIPGSAKGGDGLTAKALGVSDSAFNQYKEAVAKIESGGRYDIMGGSDKAVKGGRFGGKYQMGGQEIIAAAKSLGIEPPVDYVKDRRGNGRTVAVANEKFLNSPELQERLFDSFTHNQHKSLSGRNDKYGKLSAAEKLATLGYAHNQGAGGASKWLNTGVVESDAFGTKGNKYSKAVSAALGGPVASAQPQAQTTTPAARPGLFSDAKADYSNLPQSNAEAQQLMDDEIAKMGTRNLDPRKGFDSMATPGSNVYHPDGVDGTVQKIVDELNGVPSQHYEQTLDQNLMLPGDLQPHQMPGTIYDPSLYNVAPINPVQTESFTLPTEDEYSDPAESGARGVEERSDPTTLNQEQALRPHYDPVQSIVDELNGTTREDLRDLSDRVQQGSVKDAMDVLRGSINQVPSSTNNFPEGFFGGRTPMQIMPDPTAPNRRMQEAHKGGTGYTTEPMYDKEALVNAVSGADSYDPSSDSGFVASMGTSSYDTGRDYDAPTYRSDTSRGPGASYSYGSTPRYEDYSYTVINPEWTKWSNAQSNANQLAYEDAAGLTPGSISGGVAAIEPVKEITKTGTRKVEDGGTTRTRREPSGPRYSKYTMDMINRGRSMPQAGAPGKSLKDIDVDWKKAGQKALVGGLLGGVPGAIAGGLFSAGKQAAPQLGGILGGNYQGMYTGGGVPALSRGTQLGSAYDVYADRSDRNTWAVANSGNIVSRDADTGWTGVTSNTSGDRPVTTMTIPLAGGGTTQATQKIVCTAMNESYGFGSFRNAIWIKYAKDNLTPYHQTGYHALFLPLVNLGYKKDNKFVRSILEHIARHRSVDLRAEMKGSKRDPLGRFYRAILEPTCYLVGRMIGDKN